MRFLFAPLALIVPGALSMNTTSESVPRNSTIPIPKTWDECIGARIAEIWEAHKAHDTAIGTMSPDMACSAKPILGEVRVDGFDRFWENRDRSILVDSAESTRIDESTFGVDSADSESRFCFLRIDAVCSQLSGIARESA